MDKQTNGPMAYLQRWFEQNMPRIQAIVERVVGAITAFWEQHGERITAIVTTYLDWMVRFWTTSMQTVMDVVSVILQLLTGDFEGAGNTLRGILNRWFTFFRDTISNIVNGIRRWFSEVDWGGIGRSIMEGIANGIRNAGGMIADAARNAAQSAYDAARNLLGIGSPSRLAATGIGQPFAEGIGVGISGALASLTGSIAASLDGMVGGLAGGMAGAGAGVGAGQVGQASITQNFYGAADGATVSAASLSGVRAGLRAVGAK
jgi:phage-related protein